MATRYEGDGNEVRGGWQRGTRGMATRYEGDGNEACNPQTVNTPPTPLGGVGALPRALLPTPAGAGAGSAPPCASQRASCVRPCAPPSLPRAVVPLRPRATRVTSLHLPRSFATATHTASLRRHIARRAGSQRPPPRQRGCTAREVGHRPRPAGSTNVNGRSHL